MPSITSVAPSNFTPAASNTGRAALLAKTGASRTAFAQSVQHLIEIGLMERNPGHGHPLRPEFRLTDRGKTAAAIANKIHRAADIDADAEDHSLLRRSWTVPILTSLHRPIHFNGIKKTLVTITDRALSQSLKSMETRDWVCRDVDTEARPPRSIYRAINLGDTVSQITRAGLQVPPIKTDQPRA